ncbi:hypothetical protein M8C21_028888, partial [Ambrosia artemisiifolia]
IERVPRLKPSSSSFLVTSNNGGANRTTRFLATRSRVPTTKSRIGLRQWHLDRRMQKRQI